MSQYHCSSCGAILPDYAICCPSCWQPIDGIPSPELYEQCLAKATGRAWIAIASSDKYEIVFMELLPIAEMEFSYIPPVEETERHKYFDWNHSAVRDYLIGPYMASLPKWVTDRMVPINSDDRNPQTADKAIILSRNEIGLFLKHAPKNYRLIEELDAIRDNIALASNQDGDLTPDDFADEPYYDDDPLTIWENDGRQYSKELYDEWYDEHDKAVEEHNYWLSEKEAAWEHEYAEEERKKEEREKAIWKATMVDYCDDIWTREGSWFSRIDNYARSWRNAGVMPVICLRTSSRQHVRSDSLILKSAKRILPLLDESHLDLLCGLATRNDEAVRQLVYGDDNGSNFGYSVYDDEFPF